MKDIQFKSEKFSIIKDILYFISNYNEKYKANLNVHNIIQGEQDELEIINKISDYLLKLIYGFEKDDFDTDENINNDNNLYNIGLNDSNDILNESDDESLSEENENIFYVDDFSLK